MKPYRSTKHIKKIKRIPKRIFKSFPIFITKYSLEFDIIDKLKTRNYEFLGRCHATRMGNPC